MTNNIENSFITLITLTSFIVFFIVYKFSNSSRLNLFLDVDFNKPQSFHSSPIPRVGGLASIISLIIFFAAFNLFFEAELGGYIYFSLSFFLLGFLEDIKIELNPSLRLLLMALILLLGFIFFEIRITKTGFYFLNEWLQNSLFQYFFLLLCFLFIINGCNLVDGFNGLLAIHLIIINLILLTFHIDYSNSINIFLTLGQIFILFIFLLFNFPYAKIFFGDSGAYLFGSITALNVINTSILYENISPFFFSVLLFYLFFEVFFSFCRKIKMKKSPLKPDSLHLHMLIFYFLNKRNLKSSNYLVAIVINLTFLLFITPAIFLKEEALFCRYWFFFLIIIYLYIYNYLLKKKSNDENY